jgi:hypothetical protein
VVWAITNSVLTVRITSPTGTTGKLILSKDWACQGVSVFKDCEKARDIVHEITGGKTVHFEHHLNA